jgi:hypothetical protein
MYGNVKAPGLMVRGCFHYLLRQEDEYLNNLSINARKPDRILCAILHPWPPLKYWNEYSKAFNRQMEHVGARHSK